MHSSVALLHEPARAQRPLVLNLPHAGARLPSDVGSSRGAAELQDGKDSFIDALVLPVTARCMPLLRAQGPRSCPDRSGHAGDIGLNCWTRTTRRAAVAAMPGAPRADIVPDDGDGTSCALEFTGFVRARLRGVASARTNARTNDHNARTDDHTSAVRNHSTNQT